MSVLIRYPNSEDELKTCLKKIKLSTNEKTFVLIHKCPSTIAASQLISSEWFRSVIAINFPHISVIRLRISHGFNAKEAEKLKQHEFEHKGSFTVSYESKSGNKMVVYWKNQGEKQFRTLQMTAEGIGVAGNLLTLKFITASLQAGKPVISTSGSETDIVSLTSPSCKNALFYAVQGENLPAVRELLQLSFDINEDFWDQLDSQGNPVYFKIIDRAWNHNNMSIAIELLKANSVYPRDFSKMQASSAIIDILKIGEDMHAAIQASNQVEVTRILTENPDQRYFFASDNTSALCQALKCNNGPIYKTLYERSVTFGPDEAINLNCSYKFKDSVCNINTELARHLPNKQILTVLSMVLIPRGDPYYSQRMQQVKAAFESINKIPEVKLILQVITTNPRIKIHFDFTRDSVTNGRYTKTMHLHIAAKSLLKNRTKMKAHGVMAREPGHCAMHLVFQNERLPYAKGDRRNRKRFKKVVKMCKKLKDREPIIERVFTCYDKEAWARELIVSVPHMHAEYQDNKMKLIELKTTFEPLFSYFTGVVMPAMTAALPVLKKLANPLENVQFDDLTGPLQAVIKYSAVTVQKGDSQCFKEVVDPEAFKWLKPLQVRHILSGCRTENFFEGNAATAFRMQMKFIDNEYYGDIYEWSQWSTKDIDAIMDEVSACKVCLLVDEAGAGKSTAIRHLSVELKKRSCRHFVQDIDLRDFVDLHKKFDGKIVDVNRAEEAANCSQDSTLKPGPSTIVRRDLQRYLVLKILLEIISPASNVETAIFTKLFNAGKVIVLFTGMDELAPHFKEFFLTLSANIKALSGNQQWIATSAQHTEELKTRLNHDKAYRLLPFDEDEIEKFIRAHLTSRDGSEIQRQVQEIKQITKELESDDDLNIDINDPLMLAFICELYAAGKLTIKQLSRSTLFRDMVELKLGTLSATQSDVTMTAWEVHMVFAVISLFVEMQLKNHLTPKRTKLIDLCELSIVKKWKRDRGMWSPAAIARLGILALKYYGTDRERPEFIHRAPAEHLVANYLIDIVEEAATSEVDELPSTQFDLAMKFAAYIIGDELSTAGAVWSFIEDHLKARDVSGVKLSEPFLEFLMSSEVSGFVERTMESNYEDVKWRLVKAVCGLLKHPQLRDEKFLKQLTLVDGTRSEMFSLLFTDNNMAVECVELFGVFCASGLANWHRLTGVGGNLTEEQLKTIESLSCDDLLPQIGLDDSDVHAQPLLQLLNLILLADDIPLADLRSFLEGFVHSFSLLTLRRLSLTKTFFEVAEKRFHGEKKEFAYIIGLFLWSLGNSGVDVQQLLFCDVNLGFVQNFGEFFAMLANFFNDEREHVQSTLSYDRIKKILLFAHFKHVNTAIDWFRVTLDSDRMCKTLSSYLIENINRIITLENLDMWNKSVERLTEFSLCFKLLFNHCRHYETVRDILDKLSKCGPDWLTLTGYQLKDSDSAKCVEACEDADEAFLRQLSFLIDSTEIPPEDLERFLKNNFLKVIATKKPALECLYSQLEAITIDGNCSLLKNALLIEYYECDIHPLMLAINSDRTEIVKFYRNHLEVEEIVRIFIRHIQTIALIDSLRPSTFETFFKDLFEARHIAAFAQHCLDNAIRWTTDESDKEFIERSNKSKVIGHLLNFISQTEFSQSLLEELFEGHFWYILWYIFRSSSLIALVFEIFKRNFSGNKAKVAEWIRRDVDKTGFFNTIFHSNERITDECRSLMEFFWSSVDEFFASNRELMRAVLLGGYVFSHPLLLSIHYRTENLTNFYFTHCHTHEILSVFVTSLNSVSWFFDFRSFWAFFRDNFMSNAERKAVLKTFSFQVLASRSGEGNDGHGVVDAIEKKFGGLEGVHLMLKESTEANARSFVKLITAMLEELNAESAFYRVSSRKKTKTKGKLE